MPNHDLANTAIALIAVIISVVALVRTRKVQLRQLDLQARLEETARAQLQLAASAAAARERAQVTVALEGFGPSNRFHLRNQGAGTAHDVQFHLHVDEGRISPLGSDFARVVPVSQLPSGQDVSFLCALVHGTGTAFNCQWSWRNDDGSLVERKALITLS